MKKHIIAWEKWKDPWSWDDAEKQKEEDDKWEDSYDEDDGPPSMGSSMTSSTGQKLIVTPMGAMPLMIQNSPARIFNFWVGHSDFGLSKKVVEIISKSEGVESLDIYSPYRLRVAVGKMFKPAEVFHTIDLAVDAYFKEKGKVKRGFLDGRP